MISAGVESNITQKEIKDLVAAFYKFLQEVLSKLQLQWVIPEKKQTEGAEDILF